MQAGCSPARAWATQANKAVRAQQHQNAVVIPCRPGARVMPSSVPVDDDSLWVPVPANFALSRAKGWRVEGCTFEHLGATAMAVVNGSSGVSVVNNTFNDISCSAVQVLGGLWQGFHGNH